MWAFVKTKWNAGGFQQLEIIVTLLFLACMVPTLRGISASSDVDIFYRAAASLGQGLNIYTPPAAPFKDGMWYYYSPLFASILRPFVDLDIRILKFVWHLLNLLLVFRCYYIFKQFFALQDQKNGKYILIAIAIFSVHPVFLNLLYGQLTIFVVWSCLEGCWRFTQRKNVWGGLAYAISINIKLLPVFFFYYYLLKRNSRALFSIGFAVLFLVLLPYLWIDYNFHTQLIMDWMDLINPLNDEHVNTVGEGGFTDFASLLTKYLTHSPIAGEATFNIAQLSYSQIFWLQMAFRFVILIVTAWVVLKLHVTVFTGKLRDWADAGFVLACIPAAFPHQRDYSVLLCVPAMAVLTWIWFTHAKKPAVWATALALLSITAMGSTLFFDLFGNAVKFFIFQTRMAGFGVLLFIASYILILAGRKSEAGI